MSDTPNLGLPYISASQAQKHITHNEALVGLDTLVQTSVTSTTNTPPGSPAEGDTYLVGASPTGDWVGYDYNIVTYYSGSWRFYEPKEGWLLYDNDTQNHLMFDGTSWVSAFTQSGATWGWQNFQDSTTSGTPISIGNGTWTDLTNDAAGPLTSTTYKVPSHGSLWDSTSDELDFTSLSIGDVVTFRVDVVGTTSGANHNIKLRLAFGPSLIYSNNFYDNTIKSAGDFQAFVEFSFGMFNTDTRDNPAKLQIISDAAGDEATVNGWFIQTNVR